MRRRSWTALAAVTALAVGGAVYLTTRSSPTPAPVAVHSVVAAAPTTSTPPVPSTPASTAPAVPHDAVAPAVPTGFEIAGPSFDITATVCQMAYVRPLDPPGDQRHTVCWVKSGFGVAPGSASGGTSYILGHSWSKAPLVFNPLSELAMTQVTGQQPQPLDGVPTFPVTVINGYTITLVTANGTLTYVVTRAFAVSKQLAGNVSSLMANTPNRVVIITCAVAGGADADYNIVVDAYLQSSRAA